MKKFMKIFVVLTVVALCVSTLVGCGEEPKPTQSVGDIVATEPTEPEVSKAEPTTPEDVQKTELFSSNASISDDLTLCNEPINVDGVEGYTISIDGDSFDINGTDYSETDLFDILTQTQGESLVEITPFGDSETIATQKTIVVVTKEHKGTAVYQKAFSKIFAITDTTWNNMSGAADWKMDCIDTIDVLQDDDGTYIEVMASGYTIGGSQENATHNTTKIYVEGQIDNVFDLLQAVQNLDNDCGLMRGATSDVGFYDIENTDLSNFEEYMLQMKQQYQNQEDYVIGDKVDIVE